MIKYPDTLGAATDGYAIVKGKEVGGHRQVADLDELYALPDAWLSESRTNANNDAIGQVWYVVSLDAEYRLVDWAKRESAEGWEPVSADLKEAYTLVTDIFIDRYSYGVSYAFNGYIMACTRIGSKELLGAFPVQSRMRGCLLADDGTVLKYLPEDTWVGELLDGSGGQVMVEIPKHYRRVVNATNPQEVSEVRISEYPLPGFDEIPLQYVSAYQASIQRSTGKLASVENRTPDYRGGSNNASWDNSAITLLGRPVTGMSLESLREAARLRGNNSMNWNILTAGVYQTIFWLYLTEYAQFRPQMAGVRADATSWSEANEKNPFVACGVTNILGNGSGEYSMSSVSFGAAVAYRYRGIENPFSHIWQLVDGVVMKGSYNNNVFSGYNVLIKENPMSFNDPNSSDYYYFQDWGGASNYAYAPLYKLPPGRHSVIASSVTRGFPGYQALAIRSTSVDNNAMYALAVGGDASTYADSRGGFTAPSMLHASTEWKLTDGAPNVGTRLTYIPNYTR